jgi:muramoyltetrapeptide carboxypeptidase
MKIITPPYLNPGDCIGLALPAKMIGPEYVENANAIIQKLGFRTTLSSNIHAGKTYLAGNDKERIAGFQQLLDNSELKAILCMRGGYGSARIIDQIDFASFMKNPKWIIGYSDITVFHAHLCNLGFESLHATMPLDFAKSVAISKPVEKLFDVLTGQKLSYKLNEHPANKTGAGEGILVGGNLSVMCSLLGSKSDVETSGRILFVEEAGEPLYRIDRMMVTLKRAGKLKNLAGLIIGGLTGSGDTGDNFDLTAKEIMLDAVAGYDFPVAYDFPAGHFPENYPLIIGRKVKLEVGKKVVIDFEK